MMKSMNKRKVVVVAFTLLAAVSIFFIVEELKALNKVSKYYSVDEGIEVKIERVEPKYPGFVEDDRGYYFYLHHDGSKENAYSAYTYLPKPSWQEPELVGVTENYWIFTVRDAANGTRRIHIGISFHKKFVNWEECAYEQIPFEELSDEEQKTFKKVVYKKTTIEPWGID